MKGAANMTKSTGNYNVWAVSDCMGEEHIVIATWPCQSSNRKSRFICSLGVMSYNDAKKKASDLGYDIGDWEFNDPYDFCRDRERCISN
jgi:hypothetical protein